MSRPIFDEPDYGDLFDVDADGRAIRVAPSLPECPGEAAARDADRHYAEQERAAGDDRHQPIWVQCHASNGHSQCTVRVRHGQRHTGAHVFRACSHTVYVPTPDGRRLEPRVSNGCNACREGRPYLEVADDAAE